MDTTTALFTIIVAAGIGMIATLGILRKERTRAQASSAESTFATSTEGMKRCPSCGIGNLVTDANCSACGKPLPG